MNESASVDWSGRSDIPRLDGGSRGNPGPGGSGSIIYRAHPGDQPPQVVWAASTSLARPTTTNNYAEFVGLILLLRHAVSTGLKGIHVVGDSQMILGLMLRRAVPRRSKLRSLFSWHYGWRISAKWRAGRTTTDHTTKSWTALLTFRWTADLADNLHSQKTCSSAPASQGGSPQQRRHQSLGRRIARGPS